MHQVLVLDRGGRPSRWSSWEDALIYRVKGLVPWHLGEEVPFRGGTARASGQQSVVYVPNIIAVSNEVFDGRVSLTNQNLFQRDDHICCYCGNRFHRSQLTREHIIPVSRGGANTWMNCATACKRCNNRKGARLPEEAGMELLYAPYVPDRTEALILESRNIRRDQMEFLRMCLKGESQLHSRDFPASGEPLAFPA